MTPKGWNKVTLKEILDGSIKNGFSPIPAEQCTGYWVLGLGALSDDGLNQNEIKPVEPTSKTLDSLLSSGDFLVSRSNTPDKVGRSIRFKGEIANCSYPDLMMRFRVDERIVDADFVEAFLKSSLVRDYYKSCAAGSSSTMVKINKAIVENTPVVLPPITEQQKIAKILSAWDQAITTTEKLLNNSKHQKKALMHDLFSGKLRFSKSAEKWHMLQLKKLCLISKGVQINRNTLNNSDKYPVINGGITPSGYTDKYSCEAHTVTISEGGNSCGFVSYIDQRFWCGGHCYALKDVKINNKYLFQFLKFNEPKIMALRVGSGLPNIQKNEIESFLISVPSESEQQKIAEVLSASDREIETLQQKLACLKQEKKALMQQLLTGKRPVKVDES